MDWSHQCTIAVNEHAVATVVDSKRQARTNAVSEDLHATPRLPLVDCPSVTWAIHVLTTVLLPEEKHQNALKTAGHTMQP